MNKPTYITRPCSRPPVQPDVKTLHDIDWRTVSVAEAIDEERRQRDQQCAKLAQLKARRKGGRWNTFLQILGVRRVTP